MTRDRGNISTYQEDLATMTRENGSLNEQLIVLSRERDVLNTEKQELKSLIEKDLANMRILELERDDVIQLYKETFEESERRDATLKNLAFEKEESLKKISDYVIRNQTLAEAEDRAISEARQQEMTVRTLKQQVSDLVMRLENQTVMLEDGTVKTRELEQDLFVSG